MVLDLFTVMFDMSRVVYCMHMIGYKRQKNEKKFKGACIYLNNNERGRPNEKHSAQNFHIFQSWE
jgi:hypothetical protein